MTTTASLQEFTSSDAISKFSRLASVLCCPETKAPLQLIDSAQLRACISDSDYGRIEHDTLGAFFSRATGKAYPIGPTKVSFLPQDALSCHAESVDRASFQSSYDDDGVKRGVKEWYDSFGWKKNERGLYNDSAIYSQTKPVGHGLYEVSSHLSILDRLPGGDFVLDAASGAIPHPDYLAFSWYYKSRVCVDMSSTALSEAHTKLRDTDFCCLADICGLPFRDNVFDGAVSGYTIQHIPEGQQIRAIKELYRVIRPGAHLCIFTEVARSRAHKNVMLLVRGVRKVLKMLGIVRPVSGVSNRNEPQGELPPHELYFFARTTKWWKEVATGLSADCSIEALRLLDKDEFEQCFGHSNSAVKVLRIIENAFPKWAASASAYCLVDMLKPSSAGKAK
jgi:SAM-dependent methyltransferase/uncharacterized protein YbaR (Trm112 family)